MKPNIPHASTTRLENVSFEPEGARFELDGRTVNITGEDAAPSVAALQAFYGSAVADYRTRHSQASSPGLFSRFKSWLGGLFGRSNPPPHVVPQPPFTHAPKVDAVTRPRSSVGTRQDAAAAEPKPEPHLRAVFADQDGIHLIWQPSGKKEPQAEIAFTCRLDSEVAAKLQDCYGQLAKLGYKVAGLEVLKEQPKVDAAGCRVPAEERGLVTASTLQPVVVPQSGTLAGSRAHAREKHPAMVMKVSAGPEKQEGKANVLIAPDPLLLRSLRAGTDPARPAEERLTFLRGTLGKAGLKIVEVGLGEGKDHAPARWEDATKWLERQAEKNPVSEIKAPEPGL